MVGQEARNGEVREFQSRRLVKLEEERRKLLNAYYCGAVDMELLKVEQARINRERRDGQELLRRADATLAVHREVLELAMRFATTCATAYRKGQGPTRKKLNAGVFAQLLVPRRQDC
jgi:hypothetical protein